MYVGFALFLHLGYTNKRRDASKLSLKTNKDSSASRGIWHLVVNDNSKDAMNGTPRTPQLRSAYPATPNSKQKNATPTGPSSAPGSMQPAEVSRMDGPLVPLNVLDAPSQRFYISAFYVGLLAWRIYDWSSLVADQTNSLWLFLKWSAIDGVFLYGLPGLRVPWLEWSSFTMTVLFLGHAFMNAVLMFRVPIPIEAWLMALVKTIYDREIAVSERRVKATDVLHNSSLILGKQIIHILPEGFAMLNPEQSSFCIDLLKPTAHLPLLINQTQPISIELLRIDLDTNTNETIRIPTKEVKRFKKNAERDIEKKDTVVPRMLQIPVKQTGLYRLLRVVDESNLEVQRRHSEILVVRCPSASVKPVNQNKCRGELSDFFLQVDATPPLKVRYSRVINRGAQSTISFTWHPEDLESPLIQQVPVGALVKGGLGQVDISWARTRHHEIPVNETLGESGGWQYSIDQVQDGCGNVVNYTLSGDHGSKSTLGAAHLEQAFVVHEQPRAVLRGANGHNLLKVPRGQSTQLPVWLNPTGQYDTKVSAHVITYSFTPDAERIDLVPARSIAKTETFSIDRDGRGPRIREPGLYSLTSISTEFCSGEVLEPSSLLLVNPAEPDLTIASENIPDKCAGDAVGLRVSLDLIGTPPFQVSYNIHRKGGSVKAHSERIESMRSQLEFKPKDAGHYTYEFIEVSDDIYKSPRSLRHKQLRLEQDVKPTAWARFGKFESQKMACIEEPVAFDVLFTGEGPFALEYDLVYGDKRHKHKIDNITTEQYKLLTPVFTQGGIHTLTLASVTDRSGCKILLDQEANIEVRHQRPAAGFGYLEGKRKVHALEGRSIKLPLRLSGEGPWTVLYSKASDQSIHTKSLTSSNSVIEVDTQDIYEIKNVHDRVCPGSVDPSASRFEVAWIPKPTLYITEDSAMEKYADKYIKKAICEGDQDSMELSFTGNSPYNIKYDIQVRPEKGAVFKSSKTETYASNRASIKLGSTVAGQYNYRFSELGDQLYDRRKLSPLVVEQRIHNRPNAIFTHIGRTYSYCKEEEAGDEVIPISLTGVPPFSLEIGIKHLSSAKPEVVNAPHIEGNRYDFHIPHRVLSLGSHSVTIRKVVDANGCQLITEYGGPTVQVNVVDVPTISSVEPRTDYCVGDRISYTLSGTPPFNVWYTFEGKQNKATSSTTNFRRLAERPGVFTITAISDKASTDACPARTQVTKIIHGMPSVRISKGRVAEVDIHEGGEAEILFEFGGSPPFEFTYTRSTNAARGKKSLVLETKHETSDDYSKKIRASEEGTYEVVAIRDKYCAFSTQSKPPQRSGHMMLAY